MSSKFSKAKPTTVKSDVKPKLWTNDPTLQDQDTGKNTEKGDKFQAAQAAKVEASDKKEAKAAPKKEAKAAPKKEAKAAPKKEAKAAPKKEAKAAPKKEAKAAPKKEGKLLDTRKITVVAKENPKRGTAAERFALYKTGMTVEQYIAAGGKSTDVSWDAKQGFIKVA